MEEYVNPLFEYRDDKIKEFEQNVAISGVEYLKQLNRKARIRVKEGNLKTKDYVAMRKEQMEDKDNGKQG